MNSSQISSSNSPSQSRQSKIQFQRFQGIWKQIKKAKQSSLNSHTQQQSSNQRKSIASVKKAIQQEQQINIQTRLILTQKQLKKSKQNTNLLLKKLSQAQEQIQYLQYELQKQMKQKQQILQQYQKLKTQFNKKDNKHDKYRQQLQKSTIRQHNSENQIQKLKQIIYQKEKQVDRLNLKIKSVESTNKSLQNQIKLLNQNNKIYQKNIQVTQSFNQSGNYKGSQLLQLQQAYSCIQRLYLLLKNTQEYKTFHIPLQDIKNYHFLKYLNQKNKKPQLLQSGNKSCSSSKICQCMSIKIDEKLLWSPALCYKKILQLKIKHNSTLTEQCIEELLFQFNKIYLSKEQKSIKRLQQTYQKKLESIKRKNLLKYDQVVARKQIQRLKKQVVTQRYSKSKSFKNNQFYQNIQILKTIGQYQDQLKIKQRQILLLKERIRLMENQNANYDKILYLQGSLWVLDKVLIQIQLNTQDLQDFQTKFRQRINHDMKPQEWMNNFKFFFQNVTQNQNNLIQKILMMKESTLKKMGTKKELNKSSYTNLQHQASFGLS